jgi:hypothetical protein
MLGVPLGTTLELDAERLHLLRDADVHHADAHTHTHAHAHGNDDVPLADVPVADHAHPTTRADRAAVR